MEPQQQDVPNLYDNGTWPQLVCPLGYCLNLAQCPHLVAAYCQQEVLNQLHPYLASNYTNPQVSTVPAHLCSAECYCRQWYYQPQLLSDSGPSVIQDQAEPEENEEEEDVDAAEDYINEADPADEFPEEETESSDDEDPDSQPLDLTLTRTYRVRDHIDIQCHRGTAISRRTNSQVTVLTSQQIAQLYAEAEVVCEEILLRQSDWMAGQTIDSLVEDSRDTAEFAYDVLDPNGTGTGVRREVKKYTRRIELVDGSSIQIERTITVQSAIESGPSESEIN